MFPIRDHNPSGRVPYVVYALLALNIGIFLSYVPILHDPYKTQLFFLSWALIPQEVTQGGGHEHLVTSMFLHGGWLHLAGNMLFLWIFGDNLEDTLGHLGFAIFYLLCGLAAGMVQVVSAPYSQVPVVGASGAIAGIMGGYLLLFPKARVDVILIIVILIKILPIPAWAVLGAWFTLQVIAGIMTDAASSGVAHWAHAGGFIAGAVLIAPVWLLRGGPAFWRRNEGVPPYPEARYAFSQSTIPVIRRRRK
ncbi:rhomboid family intramembrane serine protease [Shimia sp. SDUM112013]|uniref:rhomboid family intramembrane serine protease n=1 Tax=Shimia sp. SDUM112013 TaxID=3136160 RepID=UPI0032EFF569